VESPPKTIDPVKPPETVLPARLPLALRVVLIVLGSVFVAIGVLGLFLPALPGVPLLLLAATCYAHSSSRLYAALLANRFIGPSIREWREHRSIPRRAKITALIMVVVAFGLSIGLALDSVPVRIALGVIGIALVIFLARLPSRD
jgi:uncharacterized membrane protein YbaN (DUF454 family)